MDKIKILKQVKEENIEGSQAIHKTIEQKKSDLLYYFNHEKSNDVKSKMIYSMTQQLLSLYHSDEMSVVFDGDYLIEDVIDNLNSTASSDYDEMNMSELDIQAEQDRLLLGVGILLDTGWDDVKSIPIIKCMDPLSWIPDPYIWNNEQDVRYHGFMMSISFHELESLGLLDADQIAKVKVKAISSVKDEERMRANNANAGEISMIGQYQVVLYHHYTIIDGVKSLIITNEEITDIYLAEEIKQSELDSKNGISKRPINIRWFSPKRGMQFGISLIDLARNEQRAKDFFINLKRLKAAKEVMGGDLLVKSPLDVTAFADSSNIGTRIHPVNSSDPLSSLIYAVPQEKSDINLIDSGIRDVDTSAQIATGISNMGLGVESDSTKTASESKIMQQNANLRLMLGSTYQTQAMRRFRMNIWYRSMVINFAQGDKKIVSINDGIFKSDKIFSRSDLITDVNPKMEIIKKSEQQKLYDQIALKLETQYQQTMQNPNVSPFAKRQLEKKMRRLKGLKKHEIEIFTLPADPTILSDEMNARDHVVLINNGEIPEMRADEDHVMYLTLYQRCVSGSAKQNAIAKRLSLLSKTGQIQQQAQGSNAMSNVAGNIAMSKSLNQPQQLPSLQSL